MFLHSGASLHGHEYSLRPPPTTPAPGNRRTGPLLRSTFATPITRSNTVSESARPPQLRPQRRRLSEIPPRSTPEPVVRFQEPEVEPSPPKPEPLSEDEGSYSASEASYLSDTVAAATAAAAATATAPRRSRRRRAPRMSTTYLFAHPAPKPRAKKQLSLHIRPRLLLQLQQLSADRRPRPSIDVFPSSLIAGNVVPPRFSKRFPRLFGVKGELGLHDIILVKSEDYGLNSPDADSDGEEDSLESRELVAVLSPLRREDRAEIVLDDGSVWVATPLASGSYDFVHVDEHGRTTTARWVRRTVVRTAPTPVPGAIPDAPGPASTEHKFTFSVLDPQSRRHPIMGTLTDSTLEVLDSYTTVSASSGRYPPSRRMSRSLASPATPPGPMSVPSSCSAESDDEEGAGASQPPLASPPRERTTCPVDEGLKKLIMVTAIWVSLKQGWTANNKPATLSPESASLTSPTHSAAPALVSGACNLQSRLAARHTHTRSPRSETPEPGVDRRSTMESTETGSSRLSGLLRGHALPLQTKDREPSPAPSVTPTRRMSAPARRATSTGAAFMQQRIQAQMSDASDSERGIAGVRKSRRHKVLSGDFGYRSRASAIPVDAAHIHQAGETETSPAWETPSAARPATVVDRERRTQSACYPPTEVRVGVGDSLSKNAEAGCGSGADAFIKMDNLAKDGHGAVGQNDKATRWKRFSHWVRRLGGH